MVISLRRNHRIVHRAYPRNVLHVLFRSLIMEEINKNQIAILEFLMDGYGGERCWYYQQICDDAAIDLPTAKKEIKKLRAMGLVLYVRGLMTEEGQVAGSGFTIPYNKGDEVRKILEEHHIGRP